MEPADILKGIRLALAASIFGLLSKSWGQCISSPRLLCRAVDPQSEIIRLYWKDDSGGMIGNVRNLKKYLDKKGERLVFATNGGMFKKNHSPQGLYVQNHRKWFSLDTSNGEGSFYLKPNGVFYLTEGNLPFIVPTEDYKDDVKIKLATQSGPMLLIDGGILPAFPKGSRNLNIRNGVCVTTDAKAVFAMSKVKINFYELADYFRSIGCKDALYLDGFVSKAYLPEEKWEQLDGDLAVLIGVSTDVLTKDH